MNPRSSHTITHGLFVFDGVREPQAVCQVAQADTKAKTWQRACLPHRTPGRYTDEKEHRSDTSPIRKQGFRAS